MACIGISVARAYWPVKEASGRFAAENGETGPPALYALDNGPTVGDNPTPFLPNQLADEEAADDDPLRLPGVPCGDERPSP